MVSSETMVFVAIRTREVVIRQPYVLKPNIPTISCVTHRQFQLVKGVLMSDIQM